MVVSMGLPFEESRMQDGRFLRRFSENVDDDELVWHRDREERVVEVVQSEGWFYQADNELPVLMESGTVISIPARTWHRIIRGNGDLVVAVDKLPINEAKVRKSYLKGTRKSNKEMKREIDKCAKEPRPKSCYEDWTADKTYRKSSKARSNPHVKAEGQQDTEAEERVFEEESDLALLEGIIRELLEESKLSGRVRTALKNKAEQKNAPLGALTAVYRKGLAAWLTGHRQGVNQHQWAMGRLNSFLSGGKARKVDKKEWAMVQRHREKKG
jgi:hypothetical protein